MTAHEPDEAVDEKTRNLTTTAPEAPAQAREQANEYESLFGTTDLVLDDGDVVKIPPHPDYGMLDDDRMDAYDELLFEVDTVYDRQPDIYIPEQHLENGLHLSAETKRGALMRPYRINGERVKPSHSVKVVMAAIGETEYKRLREGGRSAADVWKIWGEQGLRINERQNRDSKSDGSALDLAAISKANSK